MFLRIGAIAIALLANSRPWEGFWLSAAVVLFLWLMREPRDREDRRRDRTP